LCAPKGTPKEIVDKLYNAQKKALERYPEEIKESLRKVEYWAYFFTPQESIQKFEEERDFLLRMAQELGVVAK
jgi:tripartite-type tricarboxylate transporter receptor subunit TctC